MQDWKMQERIGRGEKCVAVAENIASTHCIYPRRDGQAELAWVTGYILRWYARPKTVARPSTNRPQRRATSLIRQTPP